MELCATSAGRGGDLDGSGVPVHRGCRDGGCLVLGGVMSRDVEGGDDDDGDGDGDGDGVVVMVMMMMMKKMKMKMKMVPVVVVMVVVVVVGVASLVIMSCRYSFIHLIS